MYHPQGRSNQIESTSEQRGRLNRPPHCLCWMLDTSVRRVHSKLHTCHGPRPVLQVPMPAPVCEGHMQCSSAGQQQSGAGACLWEADMRSADNSKRAGSRHGMHPARGAVRHKGCCSESQLITCDMYTQHKSMRRWLQNVHPRYVHRSCLGIMTCVPRHTTAATGNTAVQGKTSARTAARGSPTAPWDAAPCPLPRTG